MSMNKIDAQSFLKSAAESLVQLRAIFVALKSATTKENLSSNTTGLIGAGYHIAEDMAETVTIWSEQASQPWDEKFGEVATQPVKTLEPEKAQTNSDLIHELCGINALIESVDRMVWQDGSPGSDRSILIDATYLTKIASERLLKSIDTIQMDH